MKRKEETIRVSHTFLPVWDMNSQILILGSFPSVKSREQGFYYGHPQNRFWKLLAALYEESVPQTIEEKKSFLLRNRIAVWDVIDSCEIQGSSDSSIKNAVPSDVAGLLARSHITHVYVNGNKAAELYDKYTLSLTKIPAVKLPSTSPANAAWTLDRLIKTWSVIRQI